MPALPLRSLPAGLLAAAVAAAAVTGGLARQTPLTETLRAASRTAPLVVAHRGDSGEFPENTVPAFRSAVKKSADLVELDFRESSDGVLFCFHDGTLDRTTDVRRRLERMKVKPEELPWATIVTLDAGRWKHPRFAGTRVPTLKQAIAAIRPGAVPLIEHKSGSPKRLVALLREVALDDAADSLQIEGLDERVQAGFVKYVVVVR